MDKKYKQFLKFCFICLFLCYVYLSLLFLILSYFCFGSLFISFEPTCCSSTVTLFLLSFSISQLLVYGALSYYCLLLIPPLLPIISLLFPIPTPTKLNLQSLYPLTSVTLPDHLLRNKNLFPYNLTGEKD
jgi:hypothetical protein